MTPAAILIVLSAGPKSMAEIEDAFRAYGRRLPGDPRSIAGSRSAGTRLGRSLARRRPRRSRPGG